MDTPVAAASPAGLVSVIMPAYNAERFIAASIDSIVAQTYSAWELWVVDDGSTDSTRRVVAEYCQRDGRIHYLYQQNARQGPARNLGIMHANGELIAFLDADDIWLPTKLAEQVPQLKESKADLVFCDAYVFRGELELHDGQQVLGAKQGRYTGEEGFAACLAGNPIPILTVLTTKAALLRAGEFATQRVIQNAEDYHLWLKMLLTGSTLVGYPIILAAYRELATSVSGTDRLNTLQTIEAKLDLLNAFPAVREQVMVNINAFIKSSLDRIAAYHSELFFFQAKRYLEITNRQKWGRLFDLYEQLKLRKLAIKTIYFILNYL